MKTPWKTPWGSFVGIAALIAVVGVARVQAQPVHAQSDALSHRPSDARAGEVPRALSDTSLPLPASVDTVPVQRGQRARVALLSARPGVCLTGRVSHLTRDSLWLECEKVRSGHAQAGIRQIQISQGFPGRARRGWIAAGIGGVVSGVVVYGATDGCDHCTRAQGRQLPTLLGGMAALLGGYVSAAIATRGWPEQWVTGRLDQAH